MIHNNPKIVTLQPKYIYVQQEKSAYSYTSKTPNDPKQ